MAAAPAVIALVMPDVDSDIAILNQFDLGQAAMQMMITAAGFGIGSGQAISMDRVLAQQALGFPDDHHVALLIALGCPADRPLRPIENP